MYFVHPQIKLNSENLKKATSALFKRENEENLKQKLSFYFPSVARKSRFLNREKGSYFSAKQIHFTDMGRSALKLIIEKLNLQGTEILMPAFICDIFYPILKQYNIKPVLLDIEISTFNIKPEEIEKKISPNSKAILLCHTYGLPVEVQKIKERYSDRLIIIEDCAHSFGASINGVFTGNLGDVAFFSLYKQFPTLRGGMLVCPKDWQIQLPKTSFNLRDFGSLLNSFSFPAFLFRKFGERKFGEKIASQIVRKERSKEPAGLNRISLNLFFYFLENFKKELENRKKLALIFQAELKELGFEVQDSQGNVFCYLSALVSSDLKEKRDILFKELRKKNIFATRIWHTPIILNREAQKEYRINPNDYPNTLDCAKRVINFPLQNHYREEDIKKMIKTIQKVIGRL